MDDDRKLAPQLSRGLIGVVVLALVGGAAGTLAYSTLGESDAPNIDLPDMPGIGSNVDNTIDVAEGTSGIDPRPNIPTDETVDGPERKPAGTETTTETPVIQPKPEPQPKPKPKPDPTPPRPTRPSGNTLQKAAFVVRFNKGDKIDACLGLYRSDKAASRAAFAKWAKAHPELDGLSLERVNYSGEAILAYDGAADADPATSAKQLQARLQSLKAVRYADPDYTAHPGKGG